jgi:hypothetical protein
MIVGHRVVLSTKFMKQFTVLKQYSFLSLAYNQVNVLFSECIDFYLGKILLGKLVFCPENYLNIDTCSCIV